MNFTFSHLLLWLGVLFTVVTAVPLGSSALSPHNSTQDMSEVIADIVRRFQEEIEDELYERAYAEREALDLAKRQEAEAGQQHVEKRFFQALVMGAQRVVQMIIKLVHFIKDKIAADKRAEADFTQRMVQRMFGQNRCHNYVVCHKCTATLKGQGHRHEEFKLSLFKKTKGYDIHWGGEGTVQNIGDGGYLNWAYVGYSKSAHRNFVEFKAPPC